MNNNIKHKQSYDCNLLFKLTKFLYTRYLQDLHYHPTSAQSRKYSSQPFTQVRDKHVEVPENLYFIVSCISSTRIKDVRTTGAKSTAEMTRKKNRKLSHWCKLDMRKMRRRGREKRKRGKK